jgi:hypothetical protein
VEVRKKHRDDFDATLKDTAYSVVGKVGRGSRLLIHGLNGKTVVDSSLTELQRAWKKTLGC